MTNADSAGAKQDVPSGTGRAVLPCWRSALRCWRSAELLLVAGPLLLKTGLVSRDFARFELSGVAMYVLGAAVMIALAGLGMALIGGSIARGSWRCW